jgi:hypothetical protein
MATKRSKNADTERLDASSIERVIALLEPTDDSKPGTLKDGCAILGITYNTTRLRAILEKYKEDKARDAARRAEKRGKPATAAEIDFLITSYLEGSTVDAISSSLYRGTSFVKSILANYGVPMRQSAHSYWRPELVPDEAMRLSFKIGEKVYSMRYDSMAIVRSEFKPGVYSIYLLGEKWQEYAYQPAEELASLEHLRKMGINV